MMPTWPPPLPLQSEQWGSGRKGSRGREQRVWGEGERESRSHVYQPPGSRENRDTRTQVYKRGAHNPPASHPGAQQQGATFERFLGIPGGSPLCWRAGGVAAMASLKRGFRDRDLQAIGSGMYGAIWGAGVVVEKAGWKGGARGTGRASLFSGDT